jgi:tetratricopeptide (TPR) repeat protein
MFDREENFGENEFKRLCDTVDVLADYGMANATGEHAAWMCLWKGHAKANRALWEGKFGSGARAARIGLQAGKVYREGLSFDSTIADIYAGLGAFHYWKSEKAGLLRMIGLFNDDRKKGIEQLYRGYQSSVFSQTPSRHALAWIYVNEDEPDSVTVICNELLRQYPAGKTFLWPLAEGLFKSQRFSEALEIYTRLAVQLIKDPGNFVNLVQCSYQVFLCQRNLKRDDAASETAQKVAALLPLIPKQTAEKHHRKLTEMSRFLFEQGGTVEASAP